MTKRKKHEPFPEKPEGELTENGKKYVEREITPHLPKQPETVEEIVKRIKDQNES